MRGANDFTLAQLAAPQLPAATRGASRPSPAATRLWSAYMGSQPVVLVRSVQAARRVLLQALDVTAQDSVLLPANVGHTLLETVKRRGAAVCFGDLDYALNLCSARAVRVAWAEPILGLPTGVSAPAALTVIDHGDSLPHGGVRPSQRSHPADVVVFGLQLAAEADQAGALLVFRDPALAARVAAHLGAADRLDDGLALARLAHVQQWAPRQMAALATLRTGLHEAAGLPLLAPQSNGALARGVAARIPAECDPTTFVTYGRAENTPLAWLAEVRPLHYAAAAQHQATAEQLARWLLAPVSAGTDSTTLRQTVLGIVKAAEYLGVRWSTNPARAAQYAALLTQMYGPHHDAYRPVFAVDGVVGAEAGLAAANLQAPACRIDKRDPEPRPAVALATVAMVA